MKHFWAAVVFFSANAYALAPVRNDYEKKEDVFTEMRNLLDNAQDRSFTQVASTPNISDLRDGEIVIYISSPNVAVPNVSLMLRAGTTVFASPMFPIIKGR